VAPHAFRALDGFQPGLEREVRVGHGTGCPGAEEVGVLVAQHTLARDQAFDLLRITSLNTNRKLHDLALDVIDTGALDVTPHGRP